MSASEYPPVLPRADMGRHVSFLIRYLHPQALAVIGMTALLFVGISVQLFNPQVLRYFLDTAQAGDTSALTAAAVLFIAFALVQQVLALGASYTARSVGWTATNRLRADLARHLLRLDLAFHKTRTPGELIERIDGDVTQLANFFSLFPAKILGNGLLVLGILALLFRENPWVGIGMLIYTAITLGLLHSIQGLAAPRWAAERQAGADLYGYIEERISGAEEIRAAGAETYALHRMKGLMDTLTAQTRLAWVISALAHNLTNLVHVLGYAAGLALGVYLYSRGQASLGTAYLITYYIGMLSDPLQNLRAQAQDWQQASANLARVYELLNLQPGVFAPAGAPALPNGPLRVDFAGVTFRYEDQLTAHEQLSLTLQAINFKIEAGRVLGVLGRTGSGKSTLTRLLFRLYDPQHGAIFLNGVNLRTLPLAEVRRQIGLVTQDVQLFRASVRDNLTFFNRRISDASIAAALQTLGLWDWVQALPQGLDTLLEGGHSLSAGEAQLLAFARVFLKDPGLVILDEASSRLDPATEARLERASNRLFAGRTGVIIAHRLHTVERADDILILEGGQVVEAGPRLALAQDPTSRFAHLLRVGLEDVLV